MLLQIVTHFSKFEVILIFSHTLSSDILFARFLLSFSSLRLTRRIKVKKHIYFFISYHKEPKYMYFKKVMRLVCEVLYRETDDVSPVFSPPIHSAQKCRLILNV